MANAIVSIDGIDISVGDVGTYYCTDGRSYEAEVIAVHECDTTKLRLPANTGLSLVPAQSIDILLTKEDNIVHNPHVAAAADAKLKHTFVPAP